MSKTGKILLAVGAVVGVGALACFGLKKLLDRAHDDECDDQEPKYVKIACDCDENCDEDCDCDCHNEAN